MLASLHNLSEALYFIKYKMKRFKCNAHYAKVGKKLLHLLSWFLRTGQGTKTTNTDEFLNCRGGVGGVVCLNPSENVTA